MTSPTDPDAGRALPPLPEHDTYGIDIDDRETELWGADSMRAYALAACAGRDVEVERLETAVAAARYSCDEAAEYAQSTNEENFHLKRRAEAAEARVRELEGLTPQALM